MTNVASERLRTETATLQNTSDRSLGCPTCRVEHTPFFIIQPSSCPASSSLDCWCKGVSGGRANSLEQFAL